jgi:hypothetical protein
VPGEEDALQGVEQAWLVAGDQNPRGVRLGETVTTSVFLVWGGVVHAQPW